MAEENIDTKAKSQTALREEETLKFWQEKEIFKKSLEKESPKGNFVFYEGPPTANGRPGIHHIEARSFKDAIPRYKTMQGFHVPRKGGWDTHGLPVEIEVEKKIGSKSKKDIETFGIAAFNELCKESVWTYVDEWKKFTNRIGYWVDLENPYITYEPNYMESLWSIVKTINDKGLLYKDYRVVPWCARCGTALSSHELAQGYADVKDLSVYVKFELIDEPETFVLAWTTTPWTLPGNVALAVGLNIEYARVKITKGSHIGETYVVAKDRLADTLKNSNILDKEANFEEIAQITYLFGKDLIGKQYKPLYPYLKDNLSKSEQEKADKAFKIYDADFVTTDNGTGVVHTAVMYGQDDFILGTKNGLPKYHLVDDTGHFTPETDFLAGKFVKEEDTAVDIIKDLAHRGLLFKKEKHEHSYPHCWRCKTPLIYYARDSWYVKMSALRDELVAENEKINWEPDYIKEGRFGDWLKEVKDWAFSRERYWGTPLPVWSCEDCKKIHVIGSIQELSDMSEGKLPKNTKGELDLHKPFIDEITLKCSCGGEMKRVSEVIDVWFDSGAMPFAQVHYPFENKELIETGEGFPADYISEAIDQTRGWFYTLHAVGNLMGKGRAYKNVICLGHILDKNGKKMSKSLGNTVNPWEMMDKYGVDVLRFWMYSINQPGESKNFDEKTVDEIVKKVPNLLLNVLTFYQTYADNSVNESNKSPHVLDQWVLALLADLQNKVTQGLDTFSLLEPTRAIRAFIAELSQWYLRRSRDRFKGDDEEDKQGALHTTRFILEELSKLIAPFMPFLAEDIYQKVKGNNGKESVHLENWCQPMKVDQEILNEMAEVRKLVSLVLEARAKVNIKIRQPLQSLKIKSEVLNGRSELLDLIKDEVNVKEVIVDAGLTNYVELNATISEELKLEGQARELIRAIQDARKYAELHPTDIVTLVVETNDKGQALIEQFKSDITKTAQIKDIIYKRNSGKKIEVEEMEFKVTIEK